MTTPGTPSGYVAAPDPGSVVAGDLVSACSPAPPLDPGSRIDSGLLVRASHGGGVGVWALACPPAPGAGKPGSRPDPRYFPPLAVWGADRCHTVGNADQTALRLASAALSADSRGLIEAAFITHVLTYATASSVDPAVIAASTGLSPLAAAVGACESEIGGSTAGGVIHASRALLGPAIEAGLVAPGDGPGSLVTPAGTRWSFSSGYHAALGYTDLVATGGVAMYVDELEPYTGTAFRDNYIYGVAEKVCCTIHFEDAIKVSLV